MPCKRIGLIAAMPEEIKPLVKELDDYGKSTLGGFRLYNFSMSGIQCSLIESGIGMKRAEAATQYLITSIRPDLLVSFGFGGAVKSGMAVGDLALARKSVLCLEDRADNLKIIDLSFPQSVQQAMSAIGRERGFNVHECDFFTSNRILNKKNLSGNLPPDIRNPVLDMETWAVAGLATEQEIPLLAIRAISDASDEELVFSLDRFADSDMNIRMSKVIGTIVRTPRILPQLLRLAANCRIAGRNLAVSVKGLVETVHVL
jgi:adenosylhomocysteine nucleosidase